MSLKDLLSSTWPNKVGKTICTASQFDQYRAVNETPACTNETTTYPRHSLQYVKQCTRSNNLSTVKFVNRTASKQSPTTTYLLQLLSGLSTHLTLLQIVGKSSHLISNYSCRCICCLQCTLKLFYNPDCTCTQSNM